MHKLHIPKLGKYWPFAAPMAQDNVMKHQVNKVLQYSRDTHRLMPTLGLDAYYAKHTSHTNTASQGRLLKTNDLVRAEGMLLTRQHKCSHQRSTMQHPEPDRSDNDTLLQSWM